MNDIITLNSCEETYQTCLFLHLTEARIVSAMNRSLAFDTLTSDLHNSTEVRTRLNSVPCGYLLPCLDELPDQVKRDTQNPDLICFLTDSESDSIRVWAPLFAVASNRQRSGMFVGAMLHASRWKLCALSVDQQIVPVTPRRYADKSYSASEKLARHVHNSTLCS